MSESGEREVAGDGVARIGGTGGVGKNLGERAGLVEVVRGLDDRRGVAVGASLRVSSRDVVASLRARVEPAAGLGHVVLTGRPFLPHRAHARRRCAVVGQRAASTLTPPNHMECQPIFSHGGCWQAPCVKSLRLQSGRSLEFSREECRDKSQDEMGHRQLQSHEMRANLGAKIPRQIKY